MAYLIGKEYPLANGSLTELQQAVRTALEAEWQPLQATWHLLQEPPDSTPLGASTQPLVLLPGRWPYFIPAAYCKAGQDKPATTKSLVTTGRFSIASPSNHEPDSKYYLVLLTILIISVTLTTLVIYTAGRRTGIRAAIQQFARLSAAWQAGPLYLRPASFRSWGV